MSEEKLLAAESEGGKLKRKLAKTTQVLIISNLIVNCANHEAPSYPKISSASFRSSKRAASYLIEHNNNREARENLSNLDTKTIKACLPFESIPLTIV